MNRQAAPAGLEGPLMMLLSAAIFGYFGFMVSFVTKGQSGQTLVFVVLYMWTIRAAAIGFAVCAALWFVSRLLSSLLYSIVGLLSSLSLVVVLILDLLDPVHTIGMLFVVGFAAWSGYVSWIGLQGVLRLRRMQHVVPESIAPPAE